MCQMCDEYENELVRMGLIEYAKNFREERRREHEAAVAAAAKANRWAPVRERDNGVDVR
ncbi:MAG: hypothetical protein ABIY37_12265 [Devosia sp.]